jgi:hypothetical protein
VTGRGRPFLVLLGIAVVALAITTTAQAASTRAEYIAQADPICSSTLDREAKTFHLVGSDLDRGRFKRAAKKFARTNRVFSAGVEQLAVLNPPAADAALIGPWVAMLRAQAPLASRVTRLLRKGARPGQIAKAVNRLFKFSDRTQALVAGYGFTQCQQL